MVCELLNNGADINLREKIDGIAALFFATKKNHQEVVVELLTKCADVNVKTNNGATSLMHASSLGNIKRMKELLLYGRCKFIHS